MTIANRCKRKLNATKHTSEVRFCKLSIISDRFFRDERKGMWYRSKDLQSFRKDIKTTIIQLRKLDFNPCHCIRGIEHLYSREITSRHRNERKSHVQRILLAQAKQRIEGKANPEELQLVSAVSSMESIERAQILGEQDAEDAQDIFMEQFQTEGSTADTQLPLPHSELLFGCA